VTVPEKPPGAVRVLSWNLERKSPTSPTGRAGIDTLDAMGADVMVLTEARTGFPAGGGHTVWCGPLPYDHLGADERRVVLWSREPWRDVDEVGDAGLPVGRFVAATTDTALGPLRVVGVCVPWHMSNVTVGTRDRAPWEDHLRYLQVLEPLLAGMAGPVVVAGDFNQTIPRIRGGRRDVADAMAACFGSFTVATAGTPPGASKPVIDHVAVSGGLSAVGVFGWPTRSASGVRMSDHDGVGVDLVEAAEGGRGGHDR